ncbi:DNA helicase PIF1 Ecym_1159 [Eremothecium cymbalariae DBVPG|uniref:ATP-dependent DNA helicase PIF1 n=1 Tax=Eremothecium cymbalariae (strain CBS 270.75 / DBVPG 7215 / KCTC 17166 / NRRL Y-17582) TaxID=931890 RepID=G8JMQ5_ERECY|nr:hypothetical protein Ecym_1159 [Eremothecium cymbalariae DBVPG\
MLGYCNRCFNTLRSSQISKVYYLRQYGCGIPMAQNLDRSLCSRSEPKRFKHGLSVEGERRDLRGDEDFNRYSDPMHDMWDTSGDDEILQFVEAKENCIERGYETTSNKKHKRSPEPEVIVINSSPRNPQNDMPVVNIPGNLQQCKVDSDRLNIVSSNYFLPKGEDASHSGGIFNTNLHFSENVPLEHEPFNDELKKEQSKDLIGCIHSSPFTKTLGSDIEESALLPQVNQELAYHTQKPSSQEVISSPEHYAAMVKETKNTLSVLDYSKNKKSQCVVLSEEQQKVLKLADAGLNIFYTGSAGTGKSILLREMIKKLKDKYDRPGSVAITASTGLAACNIGGITVHSFAGIGLGKGTKENLLKKVKRSRKHVQRWFNSKCLVIDEISMIDGLLLDKLDFIARKIRKSNKAFGGIQLIFCGDFFQLPPVTRDNQEPVFAFDSESWKQAIDATIILTKVFRQQGDTKFIEMLNDMRLGKISPETELEFRKLSRPLEQNDIIPAQLYSTRAEVDRANNSQLVKLEGDCRTYNAIDGGDLPNEELKETLLANFLAPKKLDLKIGAQVMNIKNFDETLVNGSLGKVIDFIDEGTYMFYQSVNNDDMDIEEWEEYKDYLIKNDFKVPKDEDDEELKKETRTSVVKKALREKFRKADEKETVHVLGDSIFDFLKVNCDVSDPNVKANLERKKKLLQEVHLSSKGKKLPLVQFFQPDNSTRTVLVREEAWAVEDENEKPLVTRVQLPLILAWALSIHKSQGQTLSKVKVDLRRVFEKGQAYVALSRAVSRCGLQVLNFDSGKIQAHERVVGFYSGLMTADDAMKLHKPQQIKIDFPIANKKSKVSTPKHTEHKDGSITSLLGRFTKDSASRSITPDIDSLPNSCQNQRDGNIA